MFNRGDREKERLAAETTPYRRMAIDLEVDTKLQAQELELAIAERHLLTSNDCQQLSAAYLYAARHHYLVANAVAESVGDESSHDNTRSMEAATSFVTVTYQNAKNNLETAEQIIAEPRLQAGANDIQQLARTQGIVNWPPSNTISYTFVRGLIAGLDRSWTSTCSHYETIIADRLVPNDFKHRLQRLANPLLRVIDNKHTAIERITLGDLTDTTPNSVISEVYSDCQVISKSLETLTILLTMPRLQDKAFTLREQYDERAPQKKSFDPASLGTAAIKQATAPPKQPGKPFSPDALNSTTMPSPASRPFSSDSLAAPSQTSSTMISRPFNPDILDTPTPAKPKPGEFDPSILDPKKDE